MSSTGTGDTASVKSLFRTAFDEAPIGMCLIAPDGRFLQVNAALCRMMGYDEAALVRLRVGEVTHPDDRAHNLAMLQHLVDGTLDRYELRKRNLRRDGTVLPLFVTVNAVRAPDGRLLYIVAQLQDLTQQLAAEAALREAEEAHRRVLEFQALHDSLTGLPNRRALLRRLEVELGQVGRGAAGAAVFFCDLDHFKAVNDTHGHAVGDELLLAVARRLQAAGTPRDVVCRFGGDEFVVLATAVDTPEEAARRAGALVRAFETPVAVGSRAFAITLSVGVVWIAPGTRTDGTALLRDADLAMYRAKEQGRHRVVSFTDALRQELLDRVQLEGELRAALARHEFACHYQPIVDLGTGQIRQVEALVRWQHPARGLVPPGAFLPGVERAGLSIALGDEVLALAIAQAGAWHRAGHAHVTAVNLVASQLTRTLPGAVGQLLEREGLPASRLCLELTESSLLGAQDEGVAVLRDLAGQGVQLAIDDFGTGYSSFAYLRDLPVHEVKLDLSFIRRLLSDERDARVVAGMIRLAHELGLWVVAEGVEEQAQADTLTRLACDAAQGWLFARPSVDPVATAGVRASA